MLAGGLPRMRGDRPLFPVLIEHTDGATPHARGSTEGLYKIFYGEDGYPACAGIDRTIKGLLQSYGWLPRMRGDRPLRKLHPIQ